jgi:hypothetical protein
MADAQAWAAGPTPIAQDPSGDGYSHCGHPGGGIHPVLPEPLDQISEGEEIGTVIADGADDTRRCHTAIIPIRKNGRPWKEDCPAAVTRNETLRATRHYGGAFPKRWTGYHVRSRIAAKIPSPVRLNRWHAPARPQGLRGTYRSERSQPLDC